MIVLHHTLIFKPLKLIVDSDPIQKRIMILIKKDISLYAAHTNLDSAIGGLNDFIAEKLGIAVTNIVFDESVPDIRIGQVRPKTLRDFVMEIKNKLNLDYIHYCGDESKVISTVALCTGSGFSYYDEAFDAGADVLLTGDMKYHDAKYALDRGMPVVDATHFGTE